MWPCGDGPCYVAPDDEGRPCKVSRILVQSAHKKYQKERAQRGYKPPTIPTLAGFHGLHPLISTIKSRGYSLGCSPFSVYVSSCESFSVCAEGRKRARNPSRQHKLSQLSPHYPSLSLSWVRIIKPQSFAFSQLFCWCILPCILFLYVLGRQPNFQTPPANQGRSR